MNPMSIYLALYLFRLLDELRRDKTHLKGYFALYLKNNFILSYVEQEKKGANYKWEKERIFLCTVILLDYRINPGGWYAAGYRELKTQTNRPSNVDCSCSSSDSVSHVSCSSNHLTQSSCWVAILRIKIRTESPPARYCMQCHPAKSLGIT